MPESLINKSKVNKPSKFNESSNKVVNLSPKEISVKRNLPKLNEDPDVFVTITEEDRLDFTAFQYKMKIDTRMYGYAKEGGEDPKEHMEMTVRERLIGEEII
ncbi:uncharacterized protein OCT59_022224 [Rhizophagus irregularis]|uniref:Uncharacterized protein n=1 Tax=Rhizophagus irregularis (strain DAOM 181602 / DAOM 197198 / MUCL 43194) TaxID=747089 RepID=U9UIA6_RHIID|nr:hypothetical protein OCT59_022224 [Rhizophagus irregularis]GBC52015.1 hypothetical protein GLOIN_2v1471120 [Rhizophagus irregularis DAOM 181602=DAOM 197198]